MKARDCIIHGLYQLWVRLPSWTWPIEQRFWDIYFRLFPVPKDKYDLAAERLEGRRWMWNGVELEYDLHCRLHIYARAVHGQGYYYADWPEDLDNVVPEKLEWHEL